jgi:hypothetical protein
MLYGTDAFVRHLRCPYKYEQVFRL